MPKSNSSRPQISIKEAVATAANHLKSLIPSVEDLRLEEAEISDDDKFWLITLGFIDPTRKDDSLLSHLTQAQGGRYYKIFKINRTTGEVRSMKMREQENV